MVFSGEGVTVAPTFNASESNAGAGRVMRRMTVWCIECRRREFEFNLGDLSTVGIVTFACPECGTITAVQERTGGGIVIAKEDRSKWPNATDAHDR